MFKTIRISKTAAILLDLAPPYPFNQQELFYNYSFSHLLRCYFFFCSILHTVWKEFFGLMSKKYIHLTYDSKQTSRFLEKTQIRMTKTRRQ